MNENSNRRPGAPKRAQNRSNERAQSRSFGRPQERSQGRPAERSYSRPQSQIRVMGQVPAATDPDGKVRLSKRMSELGLASRREADEWIAKGWVKVDGVTVDQLGFKVLPTQKIELDRRASNEQQSRVTILLHKPLGYVSGQAEDGYEPAKVLINTASRWKEDRSATRFSPTQLKSLVPAGRLDINSTGLLVLTQDGRVAKEIIGENSTVEKEYIVRVEQVNGRPNSEFPAEKLRLLNHGLSLDGKELLPAEVSWLNANQLKFILHEGRYRQIRRMCELVGLKVVQLKRVRIGGISLGKLPVGQWRYLTEKESFNTKLFRREGGRR